MIADNEKIKKIAPSHNVQRKKFSNDFLSSKTCKQLRGFCRKNKIPYVQLSKKCLIENIHAWSNGASEIQDYKNKGLQDPDKKVATYHKLNIKIRRFCFEYANKGNSITQKEWAKRFKVSPNTINAWLKWNEVNSLILTFQENVEERVLQKFVDSEEVVVDELINIIKQKKNTDVKRKAINDFFGYRGRVNVNTRSNNVNVNQTQNEAHVSLTQNNNNIHEMTKEEIEAEIKELESMEQ